MFEPWSKLHPDHADYDADMADETNAIVGPAQWRCLMCMEDGSGFSLGAPPDFMTDRGAFTIPALCRALDLLTLICLSRVNLIVSLVVGSRWVLVSFAPSLNPPSLFEPH
jgi:hypothetical protein